MSAPTPVKIGDVVYDSITHAASELGISRNTIMRHLDKFGHTDFLVKSDDETRLPKRVRQYHKRKYDNLSGVTPSKFGPRPGVEFRIWNLTFESMSAASAYIGRNPSYVADSIRIGGSRLEQMYAHFFAKMREEEIQNEKLRDAIAMGHSVREGWDKRKKRLALENAK